MRIYRLPENPRAILFDLDSTLYTDARYAAFQADVLLRELARARGVDEDRARAEVETVRAALRERSGKNASLGNIFVELGVDIPTSVAWRERLIHPEDWLRADPELLEALTALARSFSLGLVTNNPRSVGAASLRALGVESCFRGIVGLDDTMRSKPAREPFELAARLLDSAAANCVSVGDRYDVDLALPLELGMGAVLVDGVADVLRLPDVFLAEGRRLPVR